MTKITVGLDENNKVNGGITPLKPPGGESNLTLCEEPKDTVQEELDDRCVRIMQPPGGSSSDIFKDDEEEEEVVVDTPKKPYRMKSSFELGDEPDTVTVATPQRKQKPGMNPITGTLVGEDGKEVEVSMVTMVQKFEKSCKVPPGGHSTPLW